MAVPFVRTMRSLENERFGGAALAFVVAAVLLAAWAAWLVFARVPVYEVSESARLEIPEAVHPVDARVAGRVVATHLVLGREVRAGDVLVELDADEQRLRLEESKTLLGSLAPQQNAVRAEIVAEENAIAESRQASEAALNEARAQLAEEEASARLAEDEAARVANLRARGLVSELDDVRARAEAQKQREAAIARRLELQRLERTQATDERDRRVRIERLRGDLARLNGQIATTTSTIRRLDNDIDRRTIRAPATGRLDEVQQLRTGAYVAEGQKLGAVVAPGRVKVVAEFQPAAAFGRIRQGQHGRLRLAGFPWTEYGALDASVDSVAGEIRDGTVRVELYVRSDATSAIPVQHGLPGTIEVEVERVSPAALVLRAAGKIVTRPLIRTTPPASPGAHG